MIFDFHTHTTFSDGTLEPEELIKKAAKRNIKVISVTDHDTISNYQEVRQYCQKYGVELIKGIELSSIHEGKEVHILAYFAKENDYYKLSELAEERKKDREKRIYRICEKLKEAGIDISAADLLAKSEKGSIGRPQVARAIIEKGYRMTFPEIFAEYLGNGAKAYVPSTTTSSIEIIKMVRELKGTPVLAHPGDYFQKNPEIINQFISAGLQGIEVYYSSHNQDKINFYLNLVRKYNLVATGGSDYHGNTKGREDYLGKIRIPETEYRLFFERIHFCSDN